jgi:RNA polymerase sigma factor (sigma-70 family)
MSDQDHEAVDPEEIAAEMERHMPDVQAFIRLRMGPELRAKESCADLAQSACREILQNLERYQNQGEGNFRRWLFTMALRKVKNRVEYYRAAKRDVGRERQPAFKNEGEVDSISQVYKTLSTPSQHLMRREQIEQFEAAFDQLPEHYQEVVLLARVAGQSHAEIAQATGKTEVSSRATLSRALVRLTDLLAGDRGQPPPRLD